MFEFRSRILRLERVTKEGIIHCFIIINDHVNFMIIFKRLVIMMSERMLVF